MSITWKGDQLIEKMRRATRNGVDKTMAACVSDFKGYNEGSPIKGARGNHPGWQNQTGIAEGSVRIIEFAESSRTPGSAHASGIWGSVDVDYMIHLEYLRGGALRAAADRNYPKLGKNVRDAFKREF